MKKMYPNEFLWNFFLTDYSIRLPVPTQIDLIRFTPLPIVCYPNCALSSLLFPPGFLIVDVAYIPQLMRIPTATFRGPIP